MKKVTHAIKGLSRSRQLALAGSLLAMFAVLMPWHTIGTAVLGTEHSFNGFGDQNLIIGIITFAFMFASLVVVGLPLLGIRLPRSGWKESGMLIFFGGESALLLFVLTIMHATSITRSASYDLRLGIHLALIGAALVFIGGYLLKNEEHFYSSAHAEPLAHLPRSRVSHSSHHLDLREDSQEKEKEDARMRLDI
ncbi:MAG: hypothetical protein ABIE14_00600 [Patescibacteria group bacterium]